MRDDDEKFPLMTLFVGEVRAQDEARWRAALDRLGPEGARARLAQTTTVEEDEMVEIGDLMPLPTRKFVEDWLHSEDRRKGRNKTFTALVALIAAAAAVASLPWISVLISEMKAWWTAL